MGLETATYVDDLVDTNPVSGTDAGSAGPAHIRLIKSCLQATFPNVTGPVTPDSADAVAIEDLAPYTPLTLATGVVDNSADEQPVARLFGNVLLVSGAVKSATTSFASGDTIATLPAGMEPPISWWIPGPYILYITSGGAIKTYVPLTAPWSDVDLHFQLGMF